MAIRDIFSKRQKTNRGEIPDVYTYDNLPQPLRTQIVHIWFDALGDHDDLRSPFVRTAWAYDLIVKTLCREYGVFRLPLPKDVAQDDEQLMLVNYLLTAKDIEHALDAIELSFQVIDEHVRAYDYRKSWDGDALANHAIAELNQRFKEHGVGYEYTNGQIVRVDSQLLHAEVVKPALQLLKDKQYAGAQQEFLKAHEHYRLGNSKESLNECLKAFESVMKSICDKRKWAYDKKATAKDLIQICLDKGLIPTFWQSYYASLRSLLESGVPTGRNNLGGHGQGSTAIDVPNHLVAYMLHMTAAAIVFLAQAESDLP